MKPSLCFGWRCTDAAVDVQDEIRRLREGVLLDGERVVQVRQRREVLLRVLLHQNHSLVLEEDEVETKRRFSLCVYV